MAPSEPDQIIAQRRRQVSHGPIGVHAQRAMALGKLRAVGSVDQGNVGHAGDAPAERVVDMLLARGVDQMIVAANDMRDAHVVIVDHNGEHVGRITVAAQKHEIVEVLVLPDHAALHLILNHGLAGLRGPEPDRWLHAGWGLGGVAVAPQPVVKARAALGSGFLAHRREFLRSRVAAIGLAPGQQGFGNLAVARGAAVLIDDLAIPIEFEPPQPIQDCGDGRFGRPFPIGILDPQQHLAAAAARVKPVEQRGASPSNMEKAGR